MYYTNIIKKFFVVGFCGCIICMNEIKEIILLVLIMHINSVDHKF